MNFEVNGQAISQDRMVLYTYGQPKWCSKESYQTAQRLFQGNYYRIVNYLDLVPEVPFEFLGDVHESLGYVHLGTKYYLHKDGSLLNESAFNRIAKEVDAEGYPQVTGSWLAKMLFIEQHFMDKYLNQLFKVKEGTVGEKYHALRSPKAVSVHESDSQNSDYEVSTQELRISVVTRDAQINDLDKKHGCGKIHVAVATGNAEGLRQLIANGADVNLQDSNKRMPLDLAVNNERIKAAELLIANDANIRQVVVGFNKQPILCWAAENGYTRIVKLLIDRGADTNVKDGDGYSPLYLATKRGHIDATKLLIYANAEIDGKYEWGVTALWKAAENGHEKIAELLIQRGADVNIKDQYGTSVLLRATQQGHLSIIKLLIMSGAEYAPDAYGQMDEDGNSLLHLCCIHDDLEELYLNIVDEFSEQELRRKNKAGKNVEELALEGKRVRILEEIWQHRKGAESIYDSSGCHILAHDDRTRELSKIYNSVNWKITIEEARFGVDVNKVNERGNTLLYEIVSKLCNCEDELIGKISAIETIIGYEGNIDATGRENGWTPLHLAVSSNQSEVVNLLLNNNANVLLSDVHNNKALDIAVQCKHEEMKNEKVIKILLKKVVNELGLDNASVRDKISAIKEKFNPETVEYITSSPKYLGIDAQVMYAASVKYDNPLLNNMPLLQQLAQALGMDTGTVIDLGEDLVGSGSYQAKELLQNAIDRCDLERTACILLGDC